MNTNVLCAVFKRNFVSYFANPTGYVFICLFAVLSTVGAFWPNEFFNANLANLDQLNAVFPFIMLMFASAITMSTWAEESRQGTDELLLTIPASDFDIVLGKYLAAVAIYTVALVFSMVSNYIVLRGLGSPDGGLYLATCFGYWVVGLAMLATGMVASFLTRNLTVAYILGVVFNTPLAIMWVADSVPGIEHKWTVVIKQWSVGGQFQEFGHGIVSLASMTYFVLIAVVMLYLSMVLIGRRHWVRGGASALMGLHFAVRAVALAAVAVGAVYIMHNHDLRLDATSEKLSALSPYTVKLLDDLKANYEKDKRPVRIEAFVSPEVPESYIQTRMNLLSTLRELKARAGDMMDIQVNDTERTGPMAELAKKRNITARKVTTLKHGAYSQENIFMGMAFFCGTEKVVVPFIDRGIPVEYELIRSLCTVTQQKRSRIGVVTTDAPLFGKFSMQGGMSPNWPIITELQKQYEVVQVNPTQPIPVYKPAAKSGEKDEGFAVLLVVQPSAMGPQETQNLIAAIRAGQPTVIFEDPMTFFAPEVPPTSQPRRPPDPMQAMFMRQQMPKGNLKPLWKMLGVSFSGDDGREDFVPFSEDEESRGGGADQIIWQRYNPYPKLSDIPAEFVFIDQSCGAKTPFCDDDEISSKLQHLFFPAPGFIEKRNSAPELKDRVFVPLITTGVNSGTVRYQEMVQRTPFGAMLNPDRRQMPGHNTEYCLAAHITGKLSQPKPADPQAKPGTKPVMQESDVNVVLVADIDMLTEEFFRWREQGEVPGLGLRFDFDNITLVLNALDSLAGDKRFLDLRKRRPQHRTLSRLGDWTEVAQKEAVEARDQSRKHRDEATKTADRELTKKIEDLREQIKRDNSNIDQAEADRRVEIALKDWQRRRDASKQELEEKCKLEIEDIEAKLDTETRRVQDRYKLLSVILPFIPPLLIGFAVFFARRSAEREGVSRNRLR